MSLSVCDPLYVSTKTSTFQQVENGSIPLQLQSKAFKVTRNNNGQSVACKAFKCVDVQLVCKHSKFLLKFSEEMVQITEEQKLIPAEVGEQIPVSLNVTPDGPKESGVKSTDARKESKEKMVAISTEQTSGPQNVTPDGLKKSAVKFTKKNSKELAPLTAEQKTTPAKPYEDFSVLQRVTKPGLIKSGVKSTKSQKKPRGKKGEAIQTPDDPNKKTPYQGSRRACGLFHCLNCKKGWFSPHTWKDTYQRCKGCDAEIYPHVQFKPEKGNGPMKNTPPHPQHLCQMCMKLRKPCVNFGQVPTKKAANHQREE